MASRAHETYYSRATEAADTLRSSLNKKARQSLLPFTIRTMPEFQINWHHRLLCKKLMQWINGEIPYLIVSMPPRHGKTEIGLKRLVPFIFGLHPDAQILGASYSSSLAKSSNRAIQRIMSSWDYNEVFPETRLSKTGDKKPDGQKYLKNVSEFEIVGRKGMYACAGVNGAFTGKGADYLIVDDPVKNNKEADSPIFRESVWEWFVSTALTRLQKNSRGLIIMTRWHEDDLAGRLLALSKSDPTAIQWQELNLAAIKEENIVPEDPRQIGEALWPVRFPTESLNRLKGSLPVRWWNSLYQGRPSALEGGIIKKSYIQYYTQMPARFTKVIQSWDATFNDGQNSDYVVGQVWGVWENKFYLLDQIRAQMDFVSTCDAIDDWVKKWPIARAKLIEKKANGDAIINALKRKGVRSDGVTPRAAINGLIPITPTESKSARLESVSPLFVAKDVFFPHPSIAPWVEYTIDELVKFPNAAHDDCVDCSSQALNHLAGRTQNILAMINKM